MTNDGKQTSHHDADSPPRITRGLGFAVLDMIAILDAEAASEASGGTICDRLSLRSGTLIASAKIYVTLKRLETERLVASRIVGRRRIFRLTPRGEASLAAGRRLYG